MMESLVYPVSPVNQDHQDIQHTQEWVVHEDLLHAANTQDRLSQRTVIWPESLTQYILGFKYFMYLSLQSLYVLTLPQFQAIPHNTNCPSCVLLCITCIQIFFFFVPINQTEERPIHTDKTHWTWTKRHLLHLQGLGAMAGGFDSKTGPQAMLSGTRVKRLFCLLKWVLILCSFKNVNISVILTPSQS